MQPLYHSACSWPCRSLRTGDQQIRAHLEATPTKGYWHSLDHIPTTGDNLDSPILACFSLTIANQDDLLSYGDRDDTKPIHSAITHLTIMRPEDDNSKSKLPWMVKIGELLDTGWTTAYSDGTGRDAHTAGASAAFSRRNTNTPELSHQYLGNAATVANAERMAMGMALSLQSLQQDDTILLLSDSQAAVQTLRSICQGHPPRSGIEIQVKKLLTARLNSSQDSGLAWVCAHIGIPDNEAADRLANWSSHLGQTNNCTRIVTEGGLRATGKAERATERRRPGFRLGTATNWSRPALSAYTWMRTEKGPQKRWLHHISKAENPYCPCDPNAIQTGLHITFTCPLHTRERNRLLGGKQSWEDLDTPHLIRIKANEYADGVMLFFEYIFDQLT